MATHSQYSCLENPIDRGPWWATVHGATESDTTERLSMKIASSFPMKQLWLKHYIQVCLELHPTTE